MRFPVARLLAMSGPIACSLLILAPAMPAIGGVRVTIYDLQGRLVRRLHEGVQPAGQSRIRWDGTNARGAAVSTGIYFARVDMGNAARTTKLVVAR